MPEPNPIPGREGVTNFARNYFLVQLDLREKRGIATYGTTLQTYNGRDALIDAMEECIDLWQYLCQLYLERMSP